MASLTGQKIKDTYQSLLKTDDNGLVTTAFKNVTDGSGSASGLYIQKNGIKISGSLVVTGSIILTGSLQGTASYATTSSYSLTASYALNGESTNTSSLVSTSSFNSYTGSTTSQFAGTASYAVTASYALNGGGGGPVHVPFMRNQTDPLGENTIIQYESIFNPANLTVLDSTIFTVEQDATYYVLGDLINSGSIIVSGTIHIEGGLLNSGSIVGPGIIE